MYTRASIEEGKSGGDRVLGGSRDGWSSVSILYPSHVGVKAAGESRKEQRAISIGVPSPSGGGS